MLEINVVPLLKAQTGETRDYPFDDRSPELERNAGVRGPVQGRVHLTRTQRGILVDAEYRTAVELECGRCIETFEAGVDGRVEEEFLPQVDIWTGVRLEVEDDAMRIGEDHVLDVAEAIRQDLLTRLPLQPLCSQTCRGLCSQCGADLNTQSCTCQPAPAESPFQALAQLMHGDSDNSTQDQDERPRN